MSGAEDFWSSGSYCQPFQDFESGDGVDPLANCMAHCEGQFVEHNRPLEELASAGKVPNSGNKEYECCCYSDFVCQCNGYVNIQTLMYICVYVCICLHISYLYIYIYYICIYII
jgi:hypothetical protein